MTALYGRAFFLSCLYVGGACTGQIGAPGPVQGDSSNQPPGSMPGKPGASGPCDTTLSFAPPRLWRVTDQQYVNIVHDVFGAAVVVPPDVSEAVPVGGEEIANAQGLTIGDLAVAQNYMSTAQSAAASAVAGNNLTAMLGCATPTAACVQTFITTKVARAFRRPISDGEAADMMALYQLGAADSPAEGVHVLMQYVLQAPAFLWRTELAGIDPTAAPARATPLGPYELASALAFLFLDSTPDDALWAKAAAGTITKADVLASEVDRLMALPAVKANLANKVGGWLSIHKTEATVKDPMLFPEFTGTVRDGLMQSAQLFLQDVALNGTLLDLVTSKKMFLNKELATLYGIDGVTSQTMTAVETTQPQWSAGVLTQPGLLAANSRPNRGDPIHRGLFIYNTMVCGGTIGSPPANAQTVDSALPATATERQRADFRASRADCSPCHARFDPLGLLSERYDPIGRYRATDAAGGPIDQSSVIKLGNSLDGPTDGLPDFIGRLKSSRQFADCASGKLVSFAVGRTVADDNSCALQKVRDGFAGSGSFMALYRSIATSPGFAARDGRLQ